MTDALSPLPREEAYTHDGYFGEERDDSVIDGPLFAEFFQRCANGCTGNELWQGITLDSSVREWVNTPFADHVHGWTPLMAAVGAGHSNTSRALLQVHLPTIPSVGLKHVNLDHNRCCIAVMGVSVAGGS